MVKNATNMRLSLTGVYMTPLLGSGVGHRSSSLVIVRRRDLELEAGALRMVHLKQGCLAAVEDQILLFS